MSVHLKSRITRHIVAEASQTPRRAHREQAENVIKSTMILRSDVDVDVERFLCA